MLTQTGPGSVCGMRGAFVRFRFMAYVVGVMLLILVFGMIMKYGFDQEVFVEVAGPIHGFLYVIYLVTVIDLAVKAKFSIVYTVLVMLAGTIPFVSFFAEYKVARRMAPALAAESAGTTAGVASGS